MWAMTSPHVEQPGHEGFVLGDALALGAEEKGAYPPPLTHVTQAITLGNPDISQEDLVEGTGAVDGTKRAHVDPVGVHVDHEERQPAMLGELGVGPGEEYSPACHVSQARPYFLTIYDPLLAVEHGRGTESREV